PYRVIHLLAFALLVVRFIPINWSGLRWPVFRPVIKCGQQSLEVFCVGVFLSFIAHFILDATSDALPVQILVGVGGLCIMTGVAYYRSWSKRIDRLAITNSTRQISAFEGAAPPGTNGTKQT
ncbi:MAG: OpgC domain-containing protein, partial [Bradyrhizobium sp.]